MTLDPVQMSQIHTQDTLELSFRSNSQDDQIHHLLGTQDGSEVSLLLETSRTVHQIAQIVQNTGINEHERIFYSHLMLYSMIFRYCLTRAPQALSQLNGESVGEALRYLGSLIPETGIRELPPHATLKFRLKALSHHWSSIQLQALDEKVKFARRWLKLGSPEEHLNRVDRGLEECAEMLQKQQSEKSLKKTHYEFASTSIYEPSYVVWKAAQALYDALQKCTGCSCSTQHEFRAKLELGTYRQSLKNIEHSSITGTNSKFVPCSDYDATEKLDFEIFLSIEYDWHEVRVHTIKENRHATLSRRVREATKVEQLCKSINSMGSRAWQRLVLKLKSGQLLKERIEKTNFWINKSVEPISLLRCFEERHAFFTEKTKRILSLLIGYGIFHLEGSRWLQLGWSSANIKFFQTSVHKTPLRPFIQVDMAEASGTAEIESKKKDDDDESFYYLDSGHRCSALIALAVILIEIYFAKPFRKLAQMSGIPLENPSGYVTLLDVDQVFNGEEENEIEGWRSHIPEDSPLLKAIDNCLSPEKWEDEEGNPLNNRTLKSRIYQDVIRPLELHLSSGFSKVPLDNIDRYARNLDFGRWGEAIDDHEQQRFTSTQFQASSTPHINSLPGITRTEPIRFRAPLDLKEFEKLLHQCSEASSLISLSSSLMNMSSSTNFETEYRASDFFDDEVDDGGLSISKSKDYQKWRSEYERVYEKFITTPLSGPASRPVKIAILDTGIDRDHHVFEAREGNIKARLNFFNSNQRSIPDMNGHGTFTASLLLDYAPDADLYIAKIADKENAAPNVKTVVNAMNHAIDNWGVDIISLSFGWPSTDFEGYDELEGAIDKAYSKKILIFAAASNSGGRLGRAYPASSSQVICVHSTDTLGTPSGFSPTAEPDNLNFATVGESIESAWPMLLCNDLISPQRYVKSRSGTSYATPIMAGIAAFLLQYARLHLPERSASALKRKEKMEALLKRCANRGPNYAPRGGYYYVELSLHQHNLFGRELDRINDEISETLKR
ncbi:hypothetical protein V8C43DRAFT_266424 [Trichoderma afarasin]